MFSRRHPILFFILVFTGISAVILVSFSVLGAIVVRGLIQAGWEVEDRWGLDEEKVGVVEVTGVITDPSKVLKDLKRFRKMDSVKAIVVRVDSPGGAVGPSQEIFREIQKTTEQKAVVVSMGSMAASGGYYVSAGASGVMANPGTLTGSIGVIMQFPNLEELFGKIGYATQVVKSGELKDMGSYSRQLTGKERALLQKVVDEVKEQFILAVSLGRKMDMDKVREIADGRIFSGKTAQRLGLVDKLGNFEDALAWAGEMGGITGEVKAVYPPDKTADLLEYLSESRLRNLFQDLLGGGSPIQYIYRP